MPPVNPEVSVPNPRVAAVPPTPVQRSQGWLTAGRVIGLLIALLGLALALLGGYLLSLGGSGYYLPAGIGLLASGLLVMARRRSGYWLYALVLAATVVWAIAEVGLDGWQLLPRLFALALLGALLFVPWKSSPLRLGANGSGAPGWSAVVVCLALAALVVAAGYRTSDQRYLRADPPLAQNAPAAGETAVAAFPDGEWHHYGRTMDGTRFSPLAQITPENASRLELAWRYDTGDLPQPGENANGREFNFEATPIKVGERLYFCTPHRNVVALDATSGKKVWEYKPDNDTSANMYLACRGVAWFEAPAGAPCPRRIVSTTGDARLFALDADTGRPCATFGQQGFVSLTESIGPSPPGFHFISSQPLVMRGRIVLGGWVYDNQTLGEPSGVIRVYDATTGALSWAWDLGRPDPTAPLAPGETYTRGTPNGWGSYTADEALGLVYIPLGIATPDYFGGHRRPFDDEYSSSIVALDIETGRERWHFQTVHHDIWDYDLPIGPTLVDLPDGGGGSVRALVQTTKTGQLYLLNRETGEPLAKVEEKPVPGNGLEGERLSPTQPYSVGMPSLTPPDLSESQLWGATPVDQLLCRIQFRRARYDGQYTAYRMGTTILYPAFDGIIDWHGGTVDPRRKLLIANTSYIPFTVETMLHEQALEKGLIKPWAGFESGQPYPKPKEFAVNPQYGTPYSMIVRPWLNVLGAPCKAPPWGNLVAIDLAARKVVWQRPLGTTRDMNLFNTHTNVPLPTGIFSIGGSIATAGGLIFIGAAADDYLRAFDIRTGAELWKGRLPAGGQATPTTYLGADGRQYVVIAAGGHGGMRTRNGGSVMAYALPAGAAAG